MPVPVYDYVIVGAGSAGCVLANRLTEDPSCKVLVLEAGDSDRSLWVKIPLGVGRILNNEKYIWATTTESEKEMFGNQVQWQSGRMLGGSSSVNGMLFVRGHPKRYDELEAAGCVGWGWRDVLPYFMKLEDCRFGDPRYRGAGGPIAVTRLKGDPISDAFIEACGLAGIRKTDDYNDERVEGAAHLQLSTRKGFRCSAADGYLRPALTRPNLHLISNATVSKVILKGNRATGVCYQHGGASHEALAGREVLLCAGAVRSPQLLELSGIGDAEILRNAGIHVVQHLPQVGENLQDHLMARISFESRLPLTVNDMMRSRWAMFNAFMRYAISRDGLFSTPSLTALAYVRSRDGLPYPDIRLQIGLVSGSSRLSASQESGLDLHSGFHLGGYFMYPKSRGRLHIKSLDPMISPRIEANYLSDPLDREVILAVLKWIRKIASQPPLAALVKREVRPGLQAREDDELLDYARMTGQTCWHPTGTCRMGSDPDAVVDPQLRVNGIEGLRVVDASVVPFMVSSNTNIPTIMIAERAADIIKAAVPAQAREMEAA